MLIVFKTPVHANVTMFGDVALSLIESMGHSTTVPSALMPADIPLALERLRDYVASSEAEENPSPDDEQPSDDDRDEEPAVSLRNRAMPLIDLLEAALREDKSVMWDQA